MRGIRRFVTVIITLGLLCPCVMVSAAENTAKQMRVINLHNKQAQDLIPVLQPLLPPGSAVSGSGYQLVIKTTPEEYTQLKPVIEQLDKAQPMLMISVRRVHNAAYDTKAMAGGRVNVVGTQGRDQRDQEQRIVVQDGQAAFIQTGESIPIRNYYVGIWGAAANTEYKDTTSGFYVTPHVAGQTVTLTISWQHQQLQDDKTYWNRENSPIETQKTDTVVSIPLNQWYDISRISARDLRGKNTILYDTSDVKDPDTNVFVRVETLDKNALPEQFRVANPPGVWGRGSPSDSYPPYYQTYGN